MGGIEPANAVCRLDRDGTLSILVGTVDMSGTNTAFAQIAAEAFGAARRGHPGRQRRHRFRALRRRERRQQDHLHRRPGRRARRPRRPAPAPRHRRRPAGGGGRGSRDRRPRGPGARRAGPRRSARRAREGEHAVRRQVRARVRPGRKRHGRALARLRRPPERGRGGYGDGRRPGDASPRRAGRRPGHQSRGRRGPDPGRGGAGDRLGAPRADALRRGGTAARRHAHGLRAAAERPGAARRVRAPGGRRPSTGRSAPRESASRRWSGCRPRSRTPSLPPRGSGSRRSRSRPRRSSRRSTAVQGECRLQ